MNPLREKALGRPVRACTETECRVTLYLAGRDREACPSCGGIGQPVNELAHRRAGHPGGAR